jgi:uncharacterized protein (DUF362 family)
LNLGITYISKNTIAADIIMPLLIQVNISRPSMEKSNMENRIIVSKTLMRAPIRK